METKTGNRDRTASAGSERLAAPLVATADVASAPCVTDGESDDAGRDAVVNCDENELAAAEAEADADREDALRVVENVGRGGGEVATEPMVMVVPAPLVLVLRVSALGTGMVEVARARGDANEPDMPLRLKNGENARYCVPFTFPTDVNAM